MAEWLRMGDMLNYAEHVVNNSRLNFVFKISKFISNDASLYKVADHDNIIIINATTLLYFV